MSRTYWVDLTDLYLWTGYHTGIQRTVYNLAKFYAERPDTKFFIYNDKTHQFNQIDFAAIPVPKKRVRRLTARSEAREQLKYQLKSIYLHIPADTRAKLHPYLRQTLNQAHHTVYSAKRAFTTPRHHKPLKPAVFAPGDAVIIMGAGWIRPSIVTELWHRKRSGGFKVFHFIHDMIPTYHPHLFGPGHFELATTYMFEAITASDGIITNSESSKRDTQTFITELHLPSRPITVIRLGDGLQDLAEPEAPADQVLEPGSYIFCDGTLEIRKNHILLYTAYKLAGSKGIKLPPLVVVGRPGWHAGDVIYSIKNDPDVRGLITIRKDTSDAELVWLFQNCRFAMYPATYEGWGLPHAEALALGKVSLTSSTSSLPEVAGDLVDYFNPFDPAECLNVITKYLDPQVLSAAEARIKANYRPQSWQESYNEFAAAVESQLAESET
jgi:glycosyltransferase involved in cell wall biosynthesis